LEGTTLPFGDPKKSKLDNFNSYVDQAERMYSSLDSNSSRLLDMDMAGKPVNEERNMICRGNIIGFFGCGIYLFA
jgi:hypothetical protein